MLLGQEAAGHQKQELKHEGIGTSDQRLGISTQSVSGHSSCSAQLILRSSVILEAKVVALGVYIGQEVPKQQATQESYDGSVAGGRIRGGTGMEVTFCQGI